MQHAGVLQDPCAKIARKIVDNRIYKCKLWGGKFSKSALPLRKDDTINREYLSPSYGRVSAQGWHAKSRIPQSYGMVSAKGWHRFVNK